MIAENGILNGKTLKRISIVKARKLFNDGKDIYLLPNKIALINCWMSPCMINNGGLKNEPLYNTSDELFDYFVNSFSYYNCNHSQLVKFFVEV